MGRFFRFDPNASFLVNIYLYFLWLYVLDRWYAVVYCFSVAQFQPRRW